MYFNIAFAALALMAYQVSSQDEVVVFKVYAGTCVSPGRPLNTLLVPVNPGTCINFLPSNYTIPPNIPVMNIMNECKTRGVVSFFNDATCVTPVFAAQDTCLEARDFGSQAVTIACPSTCKPKPMLTIKQCAKKMRECAGKQAPMRWTGKGCGENTMDDGGCQCKEYCGFSCKSACTSKLNAPHCKWENGVCKNKKTGETGPIEDCTKEEE